MSQGQIIAYWLKSAAESAQAAQNNFNNKHYDWAFFLWGLTIEKLLKGLIVKQNHVPLPTHDLQKLAKMAQVILNDEHKKQFNEITSYCIDARYDDYKRAFYKKVNRKPYQDAWAKTCKEIIIWLKNMY